jgi:3-dehydroquinate synthetase
VAASVAGGSADRVAVVADERVGELHGALGVDAPTLKLKGGEGIKSLGVLGEVLDFCAQSSLSRQSLLVAYGGGTVGDLTGLAASLFKRGLRVVQVPTTLLAQVDASVGGKTGINLAAGKNLAGTFHQPHAVYCDTGLLGTLTDAEYQSGLGEVLKTALVDGVESLEQLERSAPQLAARDAGALRDTVAQCVATKARVVVSDPEERGARRALNLGHTFGHAIEHAAGYGRVPHGVAVAVGLRLAAAASKAVFEDSDMDPARIGALLGAFGLPSDLNALRDRYDLRAELKTEALIEGLGHDKKGRVGAPEFVLIRKPGQLELGVPLEAQLLRELFD